MESKYAVGDFVRIKSLEALRDEFGPRIDVPFGWTLGMNKYAGGEYEILFVWESGGYELRDAGGWTFPECVFEDVDPEISFDKLEISFEDLL